MNTPLCSTPCSAATFPPRKSWSSRICWRTGDLVYRFLTERAQADAALANQPKPRGRRPRATTGS